MCSEYRSLDSISRPRTSAAALSRVRSRSFAFDTADAHIQCLFCSIMANRIRSRSGMSVFSELSLRSATMLDLSGCGWSSFAGGQIGIWRVAILTVRGSTCDPCALRSQCGFRGDCSGTSQGCESGLWLSGFDICRPFQILMLGKFRRRGIEPFRRVAERLNAGTRGCRLWAFLTKFVCGPEWSPQTCVGSLHLMLPE